MAEVPTVMVLRGRLFGRASAKVGVVVETKDGLEVVATLEHEKGRLLYRLCWSTCRGVTFVGDNVFVARKWPHRNCEFYSQDMKVFELRRLFAKLSEAALAPPVGPDFSALAKLLSSQMVYAESAVSESARGTPRSRTGRSESSFAAKIRQARARAGMAPSMGGDLSARSRFSSFSGCSTPTADGRSYAEAPALPLTSVDAWLEEARFTPRQQSNPSRFSAGNFQRTPSPLERTGDRMLSRKTRGTHARRNTFGGFPSPRKARRELSAEMYSAELPERMYSAELPKRMYSAELPKRTLATVPSVSTLDPVSPPLSPSAPVPTTVAAYPAVGASKTALGPPQERKKRAAIVPPLPLHSLLANDDESDTPWSPRDTPFNVPSSDTASYTTKIGNILDTASESTTPRFLDEKALILHTAATAGLSSEEALAALRRAASFARASPEGPSTLRKAVRGLLSNKRSARTRSSVDQYESPAVDSWSQCAWE